MEGESGHGLYHLFLAGTRPRNGSVAEWARRPKFSESLNQTTESIVLWLRFWPTIHHSIRQIDAFGLISRHIITVSTHGTAGPAAVLPAFCCRGQTLSLRREQHKASVQTNRWRILLHLQTGKFLNSYHKMRHLISSRASVMSICGQCPPPTK